jgi:hypothetical protein
VPFHERLYTPKGKNLAFQKPSATFDQTKFSPTDFDFSASAEINMTSLAQISALHYQAEDE